MPTSLLDQRPRLKLFADAFLAVGLLAFIGTLAWFGTRAAEENRQRARQLESRPVQLLKATMGPYQQLSDLRVEVDGVSYRCYGGSRGGIHCTRDSPGSR